MIFREATLNDISGMSGVRMSVKENVLSNPDLVQKKDYIEYLTEKGKGWVCEMNGEIVGLAIVSLREHNIWALFVKPGFEGKNIGKSLHDVMLDWYFNQTIETVWLGTALGTRAEKFYTKAGWENKGLRPNGEIRFEMSRPNWERTKTK